MCRRAVSLLGGKGKFGGGERGQSLEKDVNGRGLKRHLDDGGNARIWILDF